MNHPAVVQTPINFNPRSPCGERPGAFLNCINPTHFNPRSPCGERLLGVDQGFRGLVISIHAPRVGSDAVADAWRNGEVISIHAPRVGSDRWMHRYGCSKAISIHAPRVGSDCCRPPPRPPSALISIHAPRVGSDSRSIRHASSSSDFNPRSPCGERLCGRWSGVD